MTDRAATPKLDTIISEIDNLKKAAYLLEQVYLDIGAYQDGELREETWNKVRDFFGFDDNE